MSDTPKSIDEIVQPWVSFVHSEYDGTSLLKYKLSEIEAAKAQFRQLFEQAVDEVIGSDDSTPYDDYNHFRNQLRTGQRQCKAAVVGRLFDA